MLAACLDAETRNSLVTMQHQHSGPFALIPNHSALTFCFSASRLSTTDFCGTPGPRCNALAYV